ncbi:arylsulfatase [Amycolatopsis sp. Poz14]|uniref:arylsulfatase n=1 Tax=Amycolatopsis sp. Poz14 TaxID=1447705 RepID=UPI001EE93DDC|nr:arylsulfatase [Amycolatopsis sp. Poz14]MCG3757119.1 arylsulfatase [Amycolatopsis sp. Poz14]
MAELTGVPGQGTDPAWQGRIGRTVAESSSYWPEPPSRPGAPNVVLVVLDDTGWSDFGCFGSEISTPAIDRLAAGGLRYTNFHVTPLCAPTRASLLTGRNHHAAGMRFLPSADTGFPNSRGRVHPGIELLPSRLRRDGYGTYLAGKWHLAPLPEISPAGPFGNWPLAKGFDRFYGFLDGCTDQYVPELYEDNHPVDPPGGADYHLSADLADRAIGFVRDHLAFRPGSPFFLQLALGATHAPFQVPRPYLERYLGVFEKGWDRTREDRLRRQRESGLVPPETELTERNPGVPAWDTLSAEQQRLAVHLQAAFAGFLEHADAQVGRVLDALRDWGILDDTIVLVLSDNGASPEGGAAGTADLNSAYGRVEQTLDQELARLDRIGGPDGPAHYPQGWASAGNTPFRRYKQFVDLGGIRSPLVVHWPAGIDGGGQTRNQFVHAIDIMPTLLELACLEPSGPVDGRSIAKTFADPDAPSARDTQYFEMLGHRAIWHRGWKAVTIHTPGASFDADTWRLYDTAADFSECHDIAAHRPELVNELRRLWEREAEANDVFPLDDRPLVTLLGLRAPQGLMALRRLVLRPGQSHVPLASRITGTDRSMRVDAGIRADAWPAEGVILASGGSYGGYVLYLLRQELVFEHLLLDERVTCRSGPIAEAPGHLGFTLSRKPDRTAKVELFLGSETFGEALIPVAAGRLSCYGLDVGRDKGSQVSTAYQGEFALPDGVLESVTLEYLDSSRAEEIAGGLEREQ